MLGRKSVPGSAETLSQGTFVKFLLPNITDNPSRDMELIKSGKPPGIGPSAFLMRTFAEDKDSVILKVLLNIFEGAKRTWPAQWDNPGDYVLSKTLGFSGIMRALPNLVRHGRKSSDLSVEHFGAVFSKVRDNMDSKNMVFTNRGTFSGVRKRRSSISRSDPSSVSLTNGPMPTLDFKGKSFIYTHHLGVPYRELLVDATKSELAEGKLPDLDDNLIIHGDNLDALKSLLPRYAGKVDCIYIDPPYNTGGDWGNSDDVNSPLMREWLKRSANPVDREDLLRHDKWLCMMWPRLQLLRELLSEDGAVFVSIGNQEEHRLRCLMDEIFGEEQFVACFAWKSRTKPSNIGDKKRKPQQVSEYILAYAKAGKGEDKIFGLLHSGEDRSYPHKLGERKYRLQTILKVQPWQTNQRDTMTFEVEGYTPPPGQRWQGGEQRSNDCTPRDTLNIATERRSVGISKTKKTLNTRRFTHSLIPGLVEQPSRGRIY